MSDESITIVDEGNEGIEGYETQKHEKREHSKGFGSRVSAALKGALSSADQGMRNLGNKYKEYKAQEPQRMALKVKKMNEKTQFLKEKYKLTQAQQALNRLREKSRGQPPSMFGGGLGTTNKGIKQPTFDPLTFDPWKAKPLGSAPMRRIKRTKHKKDKNYVLIDGKKYYRR